MSIDAVTPAGPWSQITAAGLPYHGLATAAGTLTLPNGQTIPYPAPPSPDVYVVRRPGWVAPERTPEQLADDVAGGREWRDYALLQGTFGATQVHLGGKAVNGWVWFDPDGRRWLVSALSLGSSLTANAVQLQFRRFGEFGAAAFATTRTSNSIDLDQTTTPPLQIRFSGALRDVTASDVQRRIVDVTPDGSRAIVVLDVPHEHRSSFVAPPQRRIVGVFELVISPAMGVSVALIAGRGECIGNDGGIDWIGPQWPPLPHSHLQHRWRYAHPPEGTVCNSSTGPWVRYATPEHEVVEVAGGATWSGLVDYTTISGVSGFSWSGFAARVPTSLVRRWVGTVVGAWYRAGGAELLRADVEYSWSCDGSIMSWADPPAQTIECIPGWGTVQGDPARYHGEWTEQISTACSIALHVAGAVLVDRRYEIDVSMQHTATAFDYIAGSAEWSVRVDGVEVDAGTQSASIPWSIGSNQIAFGIGSIRNTVNKMAPGGPLPFAPSVFSLLDRCAMLLSGGDLGLLSVGVVSHNLQARAVAEYADTPRNWTLSAACSRGDVIPGSAATYPAPPAPASPVLHFAGSYQPVTGQWHAVASTSPSVQRFAWV